MMGIAFVQAMQRTEELRMQVRAATAATATLPVDRQCLAQRIRAARDGKVAARGVLFAFVSDYGTEIADGSPHLRVPVLPKPFTRAVLAAVVGRLARNRTREPQR